MKVLAVITARAGSKRLPGKHMKLINGDSVIDYVLEESRFLVEFPQPGKELRVVISSDDETILNQLEEELSILRPAELATDTTSIHEVLQHAVRYVADRYDEEYDAVLFLPANVPTISNRLINECIDELKINPSATAAMTAKPICCHPELMWTHKYGILLREQPNATAYREQDLPPRLIASGSCAVVRTKILMACKTSDAFDWLGPRIVPVLDEGAIEIHTQADLDLARKVLAE